MPIHSIEGSQTFSINMDVGCSQWLLTASTMTPQHHFSFTLPQVSKNLPAPAQAYNSVRVHPYAHPQHMKVLKHIVYFQYGYGMQSVVAYSLNHDTTTSFAGLHLTPIFQNLAPTCTDKSVREHPYAHPQHMKVFKHFVYFQNGCGRQSVVAYSLNHDTTAHLGSTLPQFSKIWPPSAQL